MLDIKFIRENSELVKRACLAKNFPVDIDHLLKLDSDFKRLKSELEVFQAQRNSLSKKIPATPPSERQDLIQEVNTIKEKMEEITPLVRSLQDEIQILILTVPQPPREDVPLGKDDKENVEIKKWGKIRNFDFDFKDHISLGTELGIIDFERGVKIAGSRSYILKGDGALLEQALLRFTFDRLVQKGYIPVSVPVLVNEAAMVGTGYFPLGREQAYYIEKDKLALVGTSEVSLCAMHIDEMLEEKDLPLRYVAQSSCFRREAGTYGKDTRGLYRVHQFQKIEMVIIAPADKDLTDELHEELFHNSEEVLQALNLPYRVVYVCSGDLGLGQVRKYDIETWMPSREGYGETHSCSSFYDFQARRSNIRYKRKDGEKYFAYTLNNTACAVPRVLLAILENYQTTDGRVEIPTALRPYMGGREYIQGF